MNLFKRDRYPHVHPILQGVRSALRTRVFEARYAGWNPALPAKFYRVRLVAGQIALNDPATVQFSHPVPFCADRPMDKLRVYETRDSGSTPDRHANVFLRVFQWTGNEPPKLGMAVRICPRRPCTRGRLMRHSAVYGT